MTTKSVPALARAAAKVAALSGFFLLTACPNGDVGAPCNHGSVDPPQSKLVTFPALSCDDLLCVYGEDKPIPATPCSDDAACNGVGESAFECNIEDGQSTGTCRLSLEYVLERSMCSKRCDSDSDCENSGITTAQKPVTDKTTCETGFKCARIQQLGEFCCEKLCVCNDDLPDTSELDMNCGEPVGGVYAFCESGENEPAPEG